MASSRVPVALCVVPRNVARTIAQTLSIGIGRVAVVWSDERGDATATVDGRICGPAQPARPVHCTGSGANMVIRALSPASSLSLIMCSDASLSSLAPNDEPGGDLVRGHRRPSALSQSGVVGRWWDGVGEQALGGGSWRAVWRRAPRTTGATSRPPALRGAIRYTRSPQYVRYLFRG